MLAFAFDFFFLFLFLFLLPQIQKRHKIKACGEKTKKKKIKNAYHWWDHFEYKNPILERNPHQNNSLEVCNQLYKDKYM
jgi:hypothetical protein